VWSPGGRRRVQRRLRKGQIALARALRPLLRRRPRAPAPASQIHLPWTGDPSCSLTVCWRTARADAPARVEVRRAGTTPWSEVRAETAPAPGPGGFLHTARLAGLDPDTPYEYRASCDARFAVLWSRSFRARTAPVGPDAAFEAVFFADTGIPGRPDGTTDVGARLIAEMTADTPLFALGAGDYAYADTDTRFVDPARAIDAWFEHLEPLLARAPFLPAWGNHEIHLGEGFAEWAPRFALPEGGEEGRSYSFDVGGAHFCALFAPGEAPPPHHLAWLDRDLAAARAAGARWLIVYQHAALFAHGSSHPARTEVRDAVVPILERHGVDLHLSGHDQSYERTHPLCEGGTRVAISARAGGARIAAGAGVVYAKISPAGKRSSRGGDFSRFADAAPPVIAARSDACHHFGRLRVDGRRLELEVVGVSEAGGPRRRVDRFAIERG
jgi:Purple acid Phosphatase, N-terminal domain/Calcineurin-like phosphoesterase